MVSPIWLTVCDLGIASAVCFCVGPRVNKEGLCSTASYKTCRLIQDCERALSPAHVWQRTGYQGIYLMHLSMLSWQGEGKAGHTEDSDRGATLRLQGH